MTNSLQSRFGNLNGWQRLWVVFTFVLGLVCALITAIEWPQQAETDEARAVFAVELGLRAVAMKAAQKGEARDELTALRLLEQGAASVRAKNYGDLSPKDLIERTRKVLRDTPYSMELDQREEADRRATGMRRWRLSALSFAAWLAAASGVYFLGWSVAWVRRGFRVAP